MEELIRIQPPVFPVGDIVMPEVVTYKLRNGINVYEIESGTEEIIRMEFIFSAGQVREYMPLLASTTNLMLREGSVHHSSEEINKKLDYYGAFLHLSVDKDWGGIIVFALNRLQEKILALCKEILFQPAFPEKELYALMKKRQQWYRINREKVQNLANDQFFESIFGKNHPYGYQVTEEDFLNLNPGLLAGFHKTHYSPEKMTVIISGKIPASTKELLEKYFGEISYKGEQAKEVFKTLPGSEREKRVFVGKQSAVQTAVRIGSPAINKRHPDYHGLKVLDSALGGYFGSRLMRNIREEKGYTYGIRSVLTSLDLSGYKMISTEVGNKYLRNTIEEIYREITILQKELIEPGELEIVRNYMLGEMVRMFDGPFSVAETFRSAWEFGFDNNYYKKFSEKIKSIEPDEIKSLANTYYNIDELIEVTAGPK